MSFVRKGRRKETNPYNFCTPNNLQNKIVKNNFEKITRLSLLPPCWYCSLAREDDHPLLSLVHQRGGHESQYET